MLAHFWKVSCFDLMSIGMDKKKITMKAIIYLKKSFVYIYRNLMSWENVFLYFSET